MNDVKQVVYEQVEVVAKGQHKALPPLTDDLPLLGSGLDSLGIAILVANLEDILGVDPFGSGDEADIPVTLGEFVRVYEHAVASQAA